MLGRCGRPREGHRLTPFGSARTTSGFPTSESQPTSEYTPHIINGHYTSSGNQPSTILSASYMPLVEDDTKFHSILQLNTIASLCLSMWLIGCYTTLKASRTVHVCLSVCLHAAWFPLLGRQRVWLPPPARR